MSGPANPERPAGAASHGGGVSAITWTADRIDAPPASIALRPTVPDAIEGRTPLRSAARPLPRLWAEAPAEPARGLETAGWHLSPLEGGLASMPAQGGEHALRLPPPTALEIATDHPFHVQGVFCEGPAGGMGHCEVPPSRMRALPAARGAAGDEAVWFWVIEKGHLTLEWPGGLHTRFGPGSVLGWEGPPPCPAQWDRARFSYVRLSMQRQALKHLAFSPGRPVQRLDHLGLAPFLAAQLHTFASHALRLSPAELGTMAGGIVQLVEALRHGMPAPTTAPGAPADAGRLQAVHRYIERNLHRNDLSVADIARETSMSRAQLYRLFATQESSVHATLREKRLQKSLGYLQQPDSQRLSVGAIAYACGFSDPSVFSKQFRQRFQLAPRDVRAAASGPRPACVSSVMHCT